MAEVVVPNRLVRIGATCPVATIAGGSAREWLGQDAGEGDLAGRSSQVGKVVVNGQDVVFALRLTSASNGLFVDVVAAESLAALGTSMDALALTTGSHPAPAKDARDDGALAAAGL